jgi:hypothetical protein
VAVRPHPDILSLAHFRLSREDERRAKIILLWTFGAIGVECDGMTSLSSTRHVASDQSADVSAHSKSIGWGGGWFIEKLQETT